MKQRYLTELSIECFCFTLQSSCRLNVSVVHYNRVVDWMFLLYITIELSVECFCCTLLSSCPFNVSVVHYYRVVRLMFLLYITIELSIECFCCTLLSSCPFNVFDCLKGLRIVIESSFIKRKIKQWWSTIKPISTNRTLISPQVTEHKQNNITTYNVWNLYFGLGQVQAHGGLKMSNGIPTLL